MPGTIMLVLAVVLTLYPVLAPWRRPFAVIWLLAWFALWGALFAQVQYEADHVVKGIVSDSLFLGTLIALFSASTLARVIARALRGRWRRDHS